MNKRFVAFLLLGLIFLGAVEWDLHERVFSPIRKVDRFWVDFCIGNTGNRVGVPSVTMVRITDDYEPVPIGIDESSQEQGSLTRLDYAAFLYAIGKLNPKTVSFMPTPVFAEKSVLNETSSIYPLKDAALQLPRLTLGSIVADKGEPENARQSLTYPSIQFKGDISQIPEIKKTVTPPDQEFLINGDAAFVCDESFRPITGDFPRIQLVARQADKVVPGFVLSSVVRQIGVGVDQITIDLEAKHPTIQVGNSYTIPISADGSMELPSHAGLTHAMYEAKTDENGKVKRSYQFASLKVEDVALAAERSDSVAQTVFDEFSGKFESVSNNLVVLGFDRTSDRTIRTANEEWLSPLTATARAIATIQSGRHTTRWPVPIRAAIYGGIFLLGLILFNFRRKAIPLILGFGVIAIVAMVLVFRETLTWSPPTAIFGLFGLMFLVGLFGKPAAKPQVANPEGEGEPETEPSTGTDEAESSD